MNGYLDFFEPDFVVESTPGLAADIDFDGKRVLPLPKYCNAMGTITSKATDRT